MAVGDNSCQLIPAALQLWPLHYQSWHPWTHPHIQYIAHTVYTQQQPFLHANTWKCKPILTHNTVVVAIYDTFWGLLLNQTTSHTCPVHMCVCGGYCHISTVNEECQAAIKLKEWREARTKASFRWRNEQRQTCQLTLVARQHTPLWSHSLKMTETFCRMGFETLHM